MLHQGCMASCAVEGMGWFIDLTHQYSPPLCTPLGQGQQTGGNILGENRSQLVRILTTALKIIWSCREIHQPSKRGGTRPVVIYQWRQPQMFPVEELFSGCFGVEVQGARSWQSSLAAVDHLFPMLWHDAAVPGWSSQPSLEHSSRLALTCPEAAVPRNMTHDTQPSISFLRKFHNMFDWKMKLCETSSSSLQSPI